MDDQDWVFVERTRPNGRVEYYAEPRFPTLTLSIEEAVQLTGVSRRVLRARMHAGTLKGHRHPRSFRPSVYSLFVDVMGYPEDVAAEIAFGCLSE